MAPTPAPPARIRPAVAADAAALLALMQALADFEGYRAQFRVTVADLLARGLGGDAQPQFQALVAETAPGALCGYAVCVETPFTYDLRPTVVLKEFYVAPAQRGLGVAAALFAAVRAQAVARGAGRLHWLVLPGNARARRFYAAQGGHEDRAWERWTLDEPAQASLA